MLHSLFDYLFLIIILGLVYEISRGILNFSLNHNLVSNINPIV